ncbi:MAG TPA: dihydrodipicolinate reductase C-terminal domain-containing protein [Ignavibacteriaceae bacterium]|nr:dihydrodipicolinate reductase C-terminal domain-containing protein [Ignavibacteriaceae bacterium]
MSNKIKYGIIGSSGRLGGEVKNVFSEASHSLVFTYDIEGETKKEKPELIIDCSLPDVFPQTIEFVKQFNVPLIIATTGLSSKNLDELKLLSEHVPVVQSFNFSTGIQVLLKLTELANEILGDWDIEISETHHRFKKDKPSGTAKMIQNIFQGKETNTSSLRLGNVAGEHTVNFGGLGEVLSIKHSATSRRTFAEGILLSAKFVLNKSKGFYSFTDVVFPK